MSFIQFLLVFWLGGVIAYGLGSFASLRKEGVFQGEWTWHQLLFAMLTIFVPMVLLWPYSAIRAATEGVDNGKSAS